MYSKSNTFTLSFSFSAAAAADYLATIFLDDFPFYEWGSARAPDFVGSGSFGQETLTEAVRGEVSMQSVRAEPADLFCAGRAGRGREQERMRVCGWGG